MRALVAGESGRVEGVASLLVAAHADPRECLGCVDASAMTAVREEKVVFATSTSGDGARVPWELCQSNLEEVVESSRLTRRAAVCLALEIVKQMRDRHGKGVSFLDSLNQVRMPAFRNCQATVLVRPRHELPDWTVAYDPAAWEVIETQAVKQFGAVMLQLASNGCAVSQDSLLAHNLPIQGCCDTPPEQTVSDHDILHVFSAAGCNTYEDVETRLRHLYRRLTGTNYSPQAWTVTQPNATKYNHTTPSWWPSHN
ncbi:hypothetical protein GNI_096140 [Gregarina niphandrodes]|uniref:Uncharacterized protein n=1 Tax=Gregarina niphandrodes TaxID=110365 RepID=A0A023B512_GRENI|nr:hypothetical protein GNI_096140 [Gregarina niphandrodes]EZG57973.1 hypothetical protein GNI_096140 [Gregarina niphandrodes]|eukprot:XP_011131002.1 hypothetical protein GNI_096140 [Gregarina niphandrodes]